MPKFTCLKCSHDFWGWGVPYQFRRGDVLVCPDCGGIIVEAGEKPEHDGAAHRLFDGTAA